MKEIAIVERDVRNRELLRFWLEDAGYCVNTFTTVAQAFGAFRRGNTFELMIVETSVASADLVCLSQPELPSDRLRIIRMEDEFAKEHLYSPRFLT